VLKLCADAQQGGPVERSGVVWYASNALKNGAVIRDVETMHLLDWACLDMATESFFAQVLGPLRVRLVKANPKNRHSVVSCLEDCLLHWDLASAQQVCAWGQTAAWQQQADADADSSHSGPRLPAGAPIFVLEHCHHLHVLV
jgi:hypothetical protein